MEQRISDDLEVLLYPRQQAVQRMMCGSSPSWGEAEECRFFYDLLWKQRTMLKKLFDTANLPSNAVRDKVMENAEKEAYEEWQDEVKSLKQSEPKRHFESANSKFRSKSGAPTATPKSLNSKNASGNGSANLMPGNSSVSSSSATSRYS